MRNFSIALLAGAGALLASGAMAAPMTNSVSGAKVESRVEQVRTVCDEHGRCYRSHGARRVIIQEDSHGYAPRHGYVQQHGYEQPSYPQHGGPGVGVHRGGPGGGVSIGVGHDRW
jgi:hypothetical protein